MQDVAQKIQPAPIDPNMSNISKDLGDEMEVHAGLSQEMFGTDDKDISGITAVLRHKSALVGLQVVFDSVDNSMKYLERS